MSREYGRSPRGERVCLPTAGRKFKRVNAVAGYCRGNIICPTIYDWNTNSAWFEEWFEWWFMPLMHENSVIIMDNASFHRKKPLIRIAESYGCRMLWLPAYSPDKNPIEHVWANLKNWLRLHSKKYATIQAAVLAYFKSE
jgi:transposase